MDQSSKTRPLTIGVTGHRFLAEEGRISAGIDDALAECERRYAARPLHLLSSLAEGADRLVARCVLRRRESRLIVPLPLPREEYLKDFASDRSRQEFDLLVAEANQVVTLPRKPTREQAYEAVGFYVVDHADLVIAIWDGKEAQGRGGTANIVRRARQRGLPIAWVHAANRRPDTLEPTSLGATQGDVTYENWPQ